MAARSRASKFSARAGDVHFATRPNSLRKTLSAEANPTDALWTGCRSSGAKSPCLQFVKGGPQAIPAKEVWMNLLSAEQQMAERGEIAQQTRTLQTLQTGAFAGHKGSSTLPSNTECISEYQRGGDSTGHPGKVENHKHSLLPLGAGATVEILQSEGV